MKKKIVIILLSLSILLNVTLFIGIKLLSSNDVDDGFNDLSQVKHEHMLSMMLEQNAGVGDYSLETRSSWPTKEDGYVFNSTLSKCEKGSQLRWDDENNVVVMVGTTSDKCYVYFDVYDYPTIVESNVTASYNNKTITISISSTSGDIVKYYYSNDNGMNYIETSDNTIVFSNLSEGDYYIKYYVVDKYGTSSEVVDRKISLVMLLTDWVISQYNGVQGNNNIYYHDSTLANGAEDNSYRYSGANPNNFVCFGSDEETCPDDNLYRIIGVFEDKVKLIKWDYATSSLLGTDGDYHGLYSSSTSNYQGNTNNLSNIATYYWNKINYSTETKNWNYSELNLTNLNKNFIGAIGDKWAGKIVTATWIVEGGRNIPWNSLYNVYKNEIINKSLTSTSKIGLIYISDYGYASIPTTWTEQISSGIPSATSLNSKNFVVKKLSSNMVTKIAASSNFIQNNWMYMGLNEWTITPDTQTSSYYDYAVLISYDGSLSGYTDVANSNAVRPTFYLNSDVTKVGDNIGSKADPIRIN